MACRQNTFMMVTNSGIDAVCHTSWGCIVGFSLNAPVFLVMFVPAIFRCSLPSLFPCLLLLLPSLQPLCVSLQLLSYHVVPSNALRAAQLTNGQQLTTALAGAAPLRVDIGDDGVEIKVSDVTNDDDNDGADVVTADILAGGSVIHIIDEVSDMPTRGIASVMTEAHCVKTPWRLAVCHTMPVSTCMSTSRHASYTQHSLLQPQPHIVAAVSMVSCACWANSCCCTATGR